MQTPADSVGTWNDNAEIQIQEKYKDKYKDQMQSEVHLPLLFIYTLKGQGGKLEKGPMSGTY